MKKYCSLTPGCLLHVGLIEYYKANCNQVRDFILVAEKVGQHLTKCMDYHQKKLVIMPID